MAQLQRENRNEQRGWRGDDERSLRDEARRRDRGEWDDSERYEPRYGRGRDDWSEGFGGRARLDEYRGHESFRGEPGLGWQGPGWQGPGWQGPGWQGPGWQGPGWWQVPGWQGPGWQGSGQPQPGGIGNISNAGLPGTWSSGPFTGPFAGPFAGQSGSPWVGGPVPGFGLSAFGRAEMGDRTAGRLGGVPMWGMGASSGGSFREDEWARGPFEGRFGERGSGGVFGPSGGSYRGRGPKGYTRSDERIREDVCDTLADHPFVDASEIEVSVRQGDVTLSGAVGAREEKRLAEDIIENISGVREVTNTLRIDRNMHNNMLNNVHSDTHNIAHSDVHSTNWHGRSGRQPGSTGAQTVMGNR